MSDPLSIEEKYTLATQTSNLKIEGGRGGAGDVIIAAAWSASTVGLSLLRLNSEWDRCVKPKAPTGKFVTSLVGTEQVPSVLNELGKPKKLNQFTARKLAFEWHKQECRLLFGKLKSLAGVQKDASRILRSWGIAHEVEVSFLILLFWLDQKCQTCRGLGSKAIEGTPSLQTRKCSSCKGSGKSNPPYGETGTKLCNYFDYCVFSARNSIKKRLYS